MSLDLSAQISKSLPEWQCRSVAGNKCDFQDKPLQKYYFSPEKHCNEIHAV